MYKTVYMYTYRRMYEIYKIKTEKNQFVHREWDFKLTLKT